MQRSKQQALMFLLGAVLVGGVLGFSAERVMSSKKPPRQSAREQMYADIGIGPEEKVKMDSVLDETNCKTSDVIRAVRPKMDSIRAEGLKTFISLMTPAQREAYQLREQRVKARMDSVEKEREAKWVREHPGKERQRRCGGSRLGTAPQSPGVTGTTPAPIPERRGPGGAPFFY